MVVVVVMIELLDDITALTFSCPNLLNCVYAFSSIVGLSRGQMHGHFDQSQKGRAVIGGEPQGVLLRERRR
jgi:hypothetical protein